MLDEPVSALDVSIRAHIITLLEELQQRLGVSYLFIAHDLAAVSHLSQRTAVMYLGKLVEVADSLELCAGPLHPVHQGAVRGVAALASGRAEGGDRPQR